MNEYKWVDKPVDTAYPIERAGYPYIFAAAFATAVFALLELTPLALLGLLISFYFCFFFRDPDRVIPIREGAVVSPADGKVVVVENLDYHPAIDGPCIKISVFMNIFDVHVNRIPFGGVIREVRYSPGSFISADKHRATAENERNMISIETGSGKRIGVMQVAGLVARRIICRVQSGETVHRGQRFGLICFGSRLDTFLPPNAQVRASVGQRVKGGADVIAMLEIENTGTDVGQHRQ